MSGKLFRRELWKEELLLYTSKHHADMEFMDDKNNIRISGLKFYTNDVGRGAMEQLKTLTSIEDYTYSTIQVTDIFTEKNNTNLSI